MKKLEGTGYRVPILCLFLAFTLICSLSALSQDKLLTNAGNTASQNATSNPAAVSCAQYAADGITCIAGQYYHSDGTQYSPTWYPTWTTGITNPTYKGTTNPPPTVSGYGAWLTGLNSGGTTAITPSSPCIGCHHSSPGTGTTSSLGGNYLTGGHKNMLRKVAPGKQLLNTQGLGVTADASKNPITWATGTIAISGGSPQLYYLYGWIDAPDSAYQGGSYTCGRCHTTGYRFDNAGPEPTQYDASTPITDAQLTRTPAGGTCTLNPTTNKTYALCVAAGGTWATSSWNLTGIQCERCHLADKQYDATVWPNTYNSGTSAAPVWTSTGGRVTHLTSVVVPSTTSTTAPATISPDHKVYTVSLVGTSGVYTGRPLPNLPINERSTATCIQCHRQEVSITPTTSGGTGCPTGQVCSTAAYNLGQVHPAQLPGQTLPGVNVSLGAFKSSGSCSIAHTPAYNYSDCITNGGTYGPYVPSMSHGANGAQAFLASPHARFTGTFDQTTQNSPDLSVTLTGTYNSLFTDWGEAPGSKNGGVADPTKNGGCAGCHDVHNTVLEVNATNVAPGLAKQCADCHTVQNSNLASTMKHPIGPGTPFPNGFLADNSDACVVCHMAAASGSPAYHYFRVSSDGSYSTFPSAAQYYSAGGGNQQPNTYVETRNGKNYNAVALDVDIACGQCHGGGDGSGKNPYGIAQPASGAPFAATKAYLANAAKGMHYTSDALPTAATPTFLLAAMTYTSTQYVGLSDTTSGATIYYTTDGSAPTYPITGTTTAYTGPITVATSTTIKAIAGGAAFTSSAVASATYNIQAASPTFSLAAGIYYTPQTVTLSDSTVGPPAANIYYTTDGTNPTYPVTGTTSLYAAGITVSVPTTIKAIAGGPNYASSAMTMRTFTIKALAPTLSPGAGTYVGQKVVTVTSRSAGSTIYYTTNGSTPTSASSSCGLTGCTITVSSSETLKAIASFGTGSDSSVTTAIYTINPVPAPQRAQLILAPAPAVAPTAASVSSKATAQPVATVSVANNAPPAPAQNAPRGSIPGAVCSNSPVPTYDSGSAYKQGQCVVFSSNVWFALQDGTDHQPDTSSTYWVQVGVQSGGLNNP